MNKCMACGYVIGCFTANGENRKHERVFFTSACANTYSHLIL